MTDQTSIKVDPETRDRLRASKRGNETYDHLINRLLNETNEPSRRAQELASDDRPEVER